MIVKGDEKSNTYPFTRGYQSPCEGINQGYRWWHPEVDGEESKKAPTEGRGFYCA